MGTTLGVAAVVVVAGLIGYQLVKPYLGAANAFKSLGGVAGDIKGITGDIRSVTSSAGSIFGSIKGWFGDSSSSGADGSSSADPTGDYGGFSSYGSWGSGL